MKVLRRKIKRAWLQVKIISYYLFRKKTSEQKVVINYLLRHKITIYPYSYTARYNEQHIPLIMDSQKGMYYYVYNGKKMFFPKNSKESQLRAYIKTILGEQDPRSPHCYLTSDFNVSEDDIVLDVGAAEGNFSLSIVDKVAQIYLFEPNPEWREALQETFEPWKEKVHIVEKYVSDKDADEAITLDTYCKDLPKISFIKADIEGFELALLKGAEQTIARNQPLKIAICTYHKQDDERELQEYLRKRNFTGQTSGGYMIYFHDKLQKPYLRKVLLRAQK